MNEEDQDKIIPLLQELKQEIQEVKEELADADVYKPENNQKTLETYSEKRRNEFWRSLKESKSEGLDYADVGLIFDVKESRAYGLMKEIVSDYEEVGMIPYTGGGEPQKLVHKKFYLLVLIRQDPANLKKDIKQRTEKSPGSHTWKNLLRLYVEEIERKEGNKVVDKSRKREKLVEEAKEVCEIKNVEKITLD
jgi:hypothetical protein